MELNDKVFVYGTLKQGHGNHRLLEDTPLIGRAFTESRFTMYSLGGFPALVEEGPKPTTIKGELYQLNSMETAKRLDRLEGYPHFYDRKVTKVVDEGGTEHSAWVYYLHSHEGPVIESGEW